MMKSLPSLKKIATLRDIGEAPLETRFSESLIKEWSQLVSSLSVDYEIPGRLDAADIKQELIQSIWKLTKRIDPISKSEDFTRMCRTELRNKCIDMNRYAKARKRMGRTGRAVQCQCCGSVSRLSFQELPICEFCGEAEDIREVETYAKDVSIYSQQSSDISDTDASENIAGVDLSATDPLDNLIEKELFERVRSSLPPEDRLVYDLMVDPTDEFLAFVKTFGHDGDHRQAPVRCYAAFLDATDRDIADAHVRIKLAILYVCDHKVSVGEMNKVTLKRLDLS